ncbi:MAG: hypothetical protein HY509_03115 [Acidobacteria bacterium]|nr:hypothetical protein [Acidobacteriota bacterium]
MEARLQGELVGCRGHLRIPVTSVEIRRNRDTASDLFFEPPAGTRVTEDGAVHQAEAGRTPGVKEAKYALLAQDHVEVRKVESSRHRARLLLVLVSDPKARAGLDLEFSGSLRRDLRDLDRFWRLLALALQLAPEPSAPGRCGSGSGAPPFAGAVSPG